MQQFTIEHTYPPGISADQQEVIEDLLECTQHVLNRLGVELTIDYLESGFAVFCTPQKLDLNENNLRSLFAFF